MFKKLLSNKIYTAGFVNTHLRGYQQGEVLQDGNGGLGWEGDLQQGETRGGQGIEIGAIFDIGYYLKHVKTIFGQVLGAKSPDREGNRS